ncbi:DUF4272 domain-containing protein [Myroides pelagicus]|uniref:DUF4272 domain-containing protein n=1 Tax=Myroides pelagicus TaxID=270914 RepID=A0A7K1GQQ1_9FLAO|nr:DUF4272 domain-containing protein [Myroides pelagicus]
MTLNQETRLAVKEENLAKLAKLPYRYIDWLPIHDETNMRELQSLIDRMSVMNALINISFGAPTDYIKSWIAQEGYTHALSTWEKDILEKANDDLTEYETNSLRWYLEGLWALMWAAKMTDILDETQWIPDTMASLLPNLAEEEENDKLSLLSDMRSVRDIYTMMDYYYRLHWYCVDERIKGQEALINEGIVYERRRALEWLLDDESDWDEIEMST